MKHYKHLILGLASFGIVVGCAATAQDIVTVAANDTRDIAVAEHQIILGYCEPRYKSAATPQDVATADKVCLPASKAYSTTKDSWEALLVVLQAARTGKATDEDVRVVAEKLATSLANLKQLAEVMQ